MISQPDEEYLLTTTQLDDGNYANDFSRCDWFQLLGQQGAGEP